MKVLCGIATGRYLLFTAFVLICNSAPSFAFACGSGSTSRAALEQAVGAGSAKIIRSDADYLVFEVSGAKQVVLFTKPGHPAHPSVVCRMPVKDGDVWRIRSNVNCGSTKAACDAFAHSFK